MPTGTPGRPPATCHPERRNEGRGWCEPCYKRWQKFRITPEEFYLMVLEREGLCDICCGLPGRRQLNIDHDHKTGKVRGLLCDNCNHLLGKAKDDTEVLARAINYLGGF